MLPHALTGFNRRFVNPLTLKLAGRASLVDLEHVGRSSGIVRHTPLMAFRSGDLVTVALTYGPQVQWLKNITAAGHCRMRIGGEVIDLGPPRPTTPEQALPLVPLPQRALLTWPIRCRHFVSLDVL